MPSDSETASAKDEVPSVAVTPQSGAHSEEGEASEGDSSEDSKRGRSNSTVTPPRDSHSAAEHADAPPLPDEPLPGQSSTHEQTHNGAGDGDVPPLPTEAPPQQEDDGWDAMWDAARQAWYFYNRFTGLSQWDNPRVQTATASADPSSSAAAAATISQPSSVAGGYNPAIHGSWDPNAPYAQAYKQADAADDDTTTAPYMAAAAAAAGETVAEGPDAYAQAAAFNSRTGRFQAADLNSDHFSDAAKSQRQMNAYFDVDRAANSHDGRSLKAERRGKQPTKKELAQWKEKRKARKEEKRRAWLRD
ncbi:putative ww domain protein [Diaporthe ampelina]|uniref:Putative ww domain protein n=1 Tax=Diaporthe ampelina TaxID=1214573 RepID=A0A0G2FH06_9PEZI|nr:putative ww domain protein [Diaporthe ampelina]